MSTLKIKAPDAPPRMCAILSARAGPKAAPSAARTVSRCEEHIESRVSKAMAVSGASAVGRPPLRIQSPIRGHRAIVLVMFQTPRYPARPCPPSPSSPPSRRRSPTRSPSRCATAAASASRFGGPHGRHRRQASRRAPRPLRLRRHAQAARSRQRAATRVKVDGGLGLARTPAFAMGGRPCERTGWDAHSRDAAPDSSDLRWRAAL